MNVLADNLPDDVATLKAMLLLAKVENTALASENLRFKAQNERLAHILRVLRRKSPMISSVVNRFRAIPSSPHPRLEIAGFAQSPWYRFTGAGQNSSTLS
jgi:hypothetical protein